MPGGRSNHRIEPFDLTRAPPFADNNICDAERMFRAFGSPMALGQLSIGRRGV